MRLRRRLLLAVAVIGGLGVLFAAWAGWRAWQVNDHLTSAVDAAHRLQDAVLDEDSAAQESALAQLQEHSAEAQSITGGPTWSVLAVVPWLGDDAAGVRTVSDVASDLAEGGIEPLLRTTDTMDSLLPREGRIDLAALAGLRAPVAEGAEAFAAADERLAEHDPSDFIGRLRSKYRDLTDQVASAHRVLGAADTAMTVMPRMLGADGPKHYLLVFQNNAEIRATGGLPGAMSLLATVDGKVEMTEQLSVVGAFGERTTSLPLSDAERQIYGEQLGTYFQDANFTPDFPRTAELMRQRWVESGRTELDGVVSFDPVALSYVLGATGPVQVGDVRLTADNAVDLLLHQVYLDYDDPVAQDVFFQEVAKSVFAKVTQGAKAPMDLVRALGRASEEHRVYVHSFNEEVQGQLAGSQVAGELTSGPESSPQVGVFLNDGTGSKMSYFLRFRADVDATYCTDGVQGLAGSARLTSTAPADAGTLPISVTGGGAFENVPGEQVVNLRVYGPVGGSISGVEINRKPETDLQAIPQDDRLVVTIPVHLAPGETVDVTWRMRTGAGQGGPVRVNVSPAIAPEATSSVVTSACG